MKEEQKISEDMKELVIARLGVMPSNYQLSIGSEGTFTKEALIKHVMASDSVGVQVVQMQFNFIKALTSGKLIETLNKYG